MPWTAQDLPAQPGRVAVVTGANSGLGLVTARALAAAGAHVVLACRSSAKADAAMADIRREVPSAKLSFQELDLASLASVRAAAGALRGAYPRLDLLVNNAGIMAIPRTLTADGFEMQLGTNHLGHFALTGLLLPTLRDTPGARVVTVSSVAHRLGRMNFDDLMGERSYGKWSAYGQSKLSNLLFTYALAARLERAGTPLIAVAAHPGYSDTNLQSVGPQAEGSAVGAWFARVGNRWLAQPAELGALPSLFAATASTVRNGDYIGPDGFREFWGHPRVVHSNAASHDAASQARLWEASEALTGVTFEGI
jgi:NAD(P)-dependent dehydrogenase (short-subunit alcohol dehydrogenase family)